MNFGCVRSPVDRRDYVTAAIIPYDTPLPKRFEWDVPVIRHQGTRGTCVGFGAAGLKNIHESVQGDYPIGGTSPLFIWTLCKQEDGMPDIDGTIIRLAMKNLLNTGIVSENELPYSLIETTTKLPDITDTLKASAAKFKISTYASVPLYDLDAMKRALTVSPVVVGLDAYDSFQYPEAGFLYPPSGRLLGGHCVIVVGYDDDLTHRYYEGKAKTGFFKIANSWGPYWGKGGFAHMSYEDFCQTNQIFELWSSVDAVVNPPEPEPPKYYKVQVGAFTVKANCAAYVEKVKAAGFSTYMPPPDSKGIYRVQVGAFSSKANAEALKDKLLAAGFAGAFIVYA